MHEFEFKEIEEATESFSQARFIGRGSHGIVYKGFLKNGNLIAVKKQSSSLQKLHDNSKLENEARILSSISTNHPNLINLLGISHDSMKNKLIVMEFMPNGTLDELLHSKSVSPGWIKRLEIAAQIAKGVKFLHEAEASVTVIVHRDIKSANVLFDSDWNARLCDFGLAVRMEDNKSENGDEFAGGGGVLRNRPAGTIGYLDPCYTVPDKLSTKIDVFSFGVLLLEIISGRKVMDFSKSPTSIVDWAIPLIGKHRALEICDKRVRVPRFMEGMIRSMLSIASRCVLSVGENRPSMKEVESELRSCRRFVEEPVRFPAWMNFLPCSLFLLRGGQRKLNDLERGDRSPAAVTAFCDGGDDDRLQTGKMTLWEILADIS